jgi:hypothetical protein
MVQDFGGPIRTEVEEPTTARSRGTWVAVVIAVAAVALLGAHFLGQDDEVEKLPTGLETMVKEAPPTLDPDGKAAEFYEGSPWARSDNLYEEMLNILEVDDDNRMPDARAFTQRSDASLTALCAEQQKLLEYNPGKWGAVAAFHAPRRAELAARGKEILEVAGESDRRDLKALLDHFDCR